MWSIFFVFGLASAEPHTVADLLARQVQCIEGTPHPSSCLNDNVLPLLGGPIPRSEAANKYLLRLYKQACEDGEATACRVLGETTLFENFGPKTKRHFTKKACELGSQPSCVALATMLSDSREPEEIEEAVQLFKSRCQAPDDEACAAVQQIVDLNEIERLEQRCISQEDEEACERAASYPTAVVLLRKQQCKAKDAPACRNVAAYYEEIEEGEQASTWRLLACEANDLITCAQLLSFHQSEENIKMIRGQFSKACSQNDLDACRVVKKTKTLLQASELKKRCKKNDYEACRVIGTSIFSGEFGKNQLQRACTAKHLPSCTTLAYQALRGPQVTAALEHLKELCNKGQRTACGHYAGYYYINGIPMEGGSTKETLVEACANGEGHALACALVSGSKNWPSNPARGAKFAEIACDLGEPMGCSLRALHLASDSKEPKLKEAISLFRKGCDIGTTIDCFNAGRFSHQLYSDSKAALPFLERGCSPENPSVCSAGRKITSENQDFIAARYFMHNECSGGGSKACYQLAVSSQLGLGTRKSHDLALLYFADACALGMDEACQIQWTSLLDYGDAEDNKNAQAYLSSACRFASPEACFPLGLLNLYGDHGVAQNKEKALEFFDSACEADLPSACLEAGRLRIFEPKSKADTTQGAKQIGRSCELQQQEACGLYGALLIKGRGVKKDKVKGKQLLMGVCDAEPECLDSKTWLKPTKTAL